MARPPASSPFEPLCVASAPADPESIAALRGMAVRSPHGVALESGPGFGAVGRFSVFAAEPDAVLSADELGWRLTGADAGRIDPDARLDFFSALRRCFEATRRDTEVELPFRGGWVGYLSYDLAPALERLPRRLPSDGFAPLACFSHYSKAWVVDHEARAIHRIGTERTPPSPGVESGALRPAALAPPKSITAKAEYLRKVERILEYIRAGDCYQVNLSHRFDAELRPDWEAERDLPALWNRCLRTSPAPFAALVRQPDFFVASTSPERFLRLETNGVVETRPIKGTRPRGLNPDADRRALAELLSSAKDQAELAMIVDLERNDLGRVCEYGSVRVSRHAVADSYANVHHLSSVVEGKLRADRDAVDLLKATFPGGSITGAPKIRAMEIIDELEDCRRGVYTGAIGYVDDGGRADFNIAIRTLVAKGRQVRYHVGGGIVADSDPEAEYQETLDKGAKLFAILTES
ncbi:MAG TPA: aminodeoxychorismate synthase component I [Planctomycetia bacterium]|nr:aminodeoxychorismate synthase component I [Planctomycetia bacterium]